MKALFVLLAMLVSTSAYAETIVTKRLKSMVRFEPLKKITVGPDDQYRAAIDPTGRMLVFTHKADLVAHLQIQDLKTGEVQDLLPLSADSQEAAFSPDGKIAFTYYRFNARGDICYIAPPEFPLKPYKEEAIHCLKRSVAQSSSERANPFWKSSGELGFIERDVQKQSMKIISEQIDTSSQAVLAEGKVWSPSMVPGGHYLVYNELSGSSDNISRGFILKDLNSGQTKTLHFDLPGLSGFPSLSEDEAFLYFTHYFNDTNHDHVIDGSDNSVVFRIPLKTALANPVGTDIYPEQLTSVESSCSFPRAFHDSLYLTCAFEGSLDIYQVPSSGIIPPEWGVKLLTNALDTSRTYQDRILVLNAMKYRLGANTPHVDYRLMTNHILADDTVAARFFLDRLKKVSSPSEQNFFAILRIFLEARELKKSQTKGEISREFEHEMSALESRLNKIRGEPRIHAIVAGLIKSFLDRAAETQVAIKRVHFDNNTRPIERYLYFTLAGELYRLNPKTALPIYLDSFRQAMMAQELSEEAHIYYASTLLQLLRNTEPLRPARIARIQQINQNLQQAPSTLLKSEAVSLRLIEAADDKSKITIYHELDQLMSSTRDDYFLRKALYVRAIVNFSETAQFKFLSFIASNWLRFTAADDTEFAYARAVFSDAALDQAYDSWGKKNFNFSRDFFFQSLSLTDDLESHEGYINSLMALNHRSEIDERYKNLKAHEFIDDNMKFVDALLLLIDQAPTAEKDDSYVGHVDKAIAKLNRMIQDRDSAVRHLLLGYCYLEKLLRTSSGFDFDKEIFQNAHHELMLAYDLGHDNDRIKAATLTNLGILHIRAQNHGLASKFLALRKKLESEVVAENPRDDIYEQSQLQTAWLLSEALFHAHQPDAAAAELIHLKGPLPTPVLERQAFYSMIAGHYKESAAIYGQLLKDNLIQGDHNLSKAQLGYGYSLLKSNRMTEAHDALAASIDRIHHLPKLKADRYRLVDFEPARLELIAEGLLAQASTGEERIEALKQRGALLISAAKLVDQPAPKLIQNRLQLADALSPSHPEKAAETMKETLKLTEDYGDKNQYLGNAVFRSTVDYLVHAILHPEFYAKEDPSRLKKVIARAITSYDAQKAHPPLLDFQKAKLELLWAIFSRKVLSTADGLSADTVLSANIALKTAMPIPWQELEQLASIAH